MRKVLIVFLMTVMGVLMGTSPVQGDAPVLVECIDNGIAYVSGGVGIEERKALRARENDFNLKLVFASVSGHYLSNIDVIIQNSKGDTLVKIKSDGPWVLLDMDHGDYKVIADHLAGMNAS